MCKFFGIVLIALLFSGFLSCNEGSISRESIKPLNPSLQVELIRYEQLLQALPENNLVQAFHKEIVPQFPAFSKLYTQSIIEAADSASLHRELMLVRADSSYLQLIEEVENRLGDLSEVKRQLSQLLENYLHMMELPPAALPRAYTFISGFAYQAFLFDDAGKNGIGIGLDMFLGDDFPYQQIHPADPLFSQYLVRTYTKEHIVRKVAEVLAEDMMIPPAKSDFLHLMIWGGKKLYLVDQLLDFVPDTIITEYSEEQLNWCRNNEAEMWQFFFEEDLFYTTDLRKFSKLVGPAPTSPGMPKESPGRTGNYMGWQIVRSFMNRFPETSVRQLIAMDDAQKLLDLSRYKPPR